MLMELTPAEQKEMYLTIMKIAPLVEKLDHTVNGNGKKGLVKKMDEVELRLSSLSMSFWKCHNKKISQSQKDAEQVASVIGVAKKFFTPLTVRVILIIIGATTIGGGGWIGFKAMLHTVVIEVAKSMATK